MKKWNQILAFLFACVLAVSSMTACRNKTGDGNADDAKAYTNLSPEQVYDALLNTNDAQFTLDRIVISSEDRRHDLMVYKKDNDLYSSTGNHTSESSPENNFSSNHITDQDTGYNYSYSDEKAVWIRRESTDDFGWKDAMKMLFPSCCGSLFTDDDNLEKVASNRYKVRDDVLADFIAEDADGILNREIGDLPYRVEAYMESAGAVYTFYVKVETLDGTIQIESKNIVEFTDIVIEIPETYEIEENS
ncbi:MAG: hypothetical protein IJX76_05525 [Clostridia bacterium]|nr:hypothetical protein [Clostridia bacterium]